mmetsp:Transcript_48774/g.139521  ORF Transcript_48774/g.139521 Transcript_48774/m.139521 type:complete len:765 (-) Transcript_48774:315-2609(-)
MVAMHEGGARRFLALGGLMALAAYHAKPRALALAVHGTKTGPAVGQQRRGLAPVSITGVSKHRLLAAQQGQETALRLRSFGGRRTGSRSVMPARRRTIRNGMSFTELVKDIAANPRVLIGEIAVVVILSGIFEKLEHKARKRFSQPGSETGAEILNVLFKEITVLGFVAFSIFLFTHTGTADVIAPQILRTACITVPGHNPLSATFETVHMMIFLLLVVLLAQAAAMFLATERITKRWGGFERAVSYGENKESFESRFVQAGYLTRVSDSSSPRGVKLVQQKPFKYGESLWRRVVRRAGPLHKLVMWRAIRHEFLFPREESPAGGTVRRVPDPALFSMEDYFRSRLGKVVLSLIHVDRWTWLVTLVLLAVPLYVCKTFVHVPEEAVHCVVAWGIALMGVVMTVCLERDTYKVCPPVPESVPKILQLFAGESVQTLRRTKLPGWKDRPGVATMDAEGVPRLGVPEAMRGSPRLASNSYKLLFKMLAFFQAVSVTSLILSHLSSPLLGRAETIWYILAWLEWPFMLFMIVPVIIRRLTIRTSIESEKDERLIRKVTTQTKESLLRDYGRLVQVMGFERRAKLGGEPWTTAEGEWTSKQAIQTLLLGLRKFEKLSPVEKREIWSLFSGWDANNNGVAETRELTEAFASMGSSESQESVDALIRMVDFDDAKSMNWMKFKAVFGLATAVRPNQELCEDLKASFDFLDTNKNGELSIFELADGFKRMNYGIGLDDIANLLFLHFGMAKPKITIDEFVEWIVADRAAVSG